MKKMIVAASLLSLVLSAVAASSAQNDQEYQKWQAGVIAKIQAKSDYRRLPLDSKETQEHFIDISYRAFKNEISMGEFKKQLNEKYPGYTSTVDWLANQLPAFR